MRFSPALMTAAEIARYDYIAVARRQLVERGVDAYMAQLGAMDCFNSRYRTNPITDAAEWFKGWTHD